MLWWYLKERSCGFLGFESSKDQSIFFIYLVTHYMEQSPFWEANRFSASQEIPCILWNPKFHCHLSLSWIRSIQSMPPHPTSWRSILILSSHLRLGLPSSLFPSGFPTKTLYTPLFSPIRATCPARLILLDLITRTILGEKYRSLRFSLCSSVCIFHTLNKSKIFWKFPIPDPLPWFGSHVILQHLFQPSSYLLSSSQSG